MHIAAWQMPRQISNNKRDNRTHEIKYKLRKITT